MFYSTCEIQFMSKCHGEKLRHSRENVKSHNKKEKRFKASGMLLGFISKVMGN